MPLSQKTQIQSPGSTRQNDRNKSSKLFSDLYTYTMAHTHNVKKKKIHFCFKLSFLFSLDKYVTGGD